MRQHGFLALPLVAYGAIAAGVVILGLSGATYVQTKRLNATKSEYAAFKANIKLLSDEQERRTKETITKQKGVTAHVQKSYRGALAELNRMREHRSSKLPSTTLDTVGASVAALKLPPDSPDITGPAAEDALRLHFLQEWVRQHGFPVQ